MTSHEASVLIGSAAVNVVLVGLLVWSRLTIIDLRCEADKWRRRWNDKYSELENERNLVRELGEELATVKAARERSKKKGEALRALMDSESVELVEGKEIRLL